MNTNFNADQLTTLSRKGDIARFDGKNVVVTVDGEQFAGKLESYVDGFSVVSLFVPGAYLKRDNMGVWHEQSFIDITSPMFENYLAEGVEGLSVEE